MNISRLKIPGWGGLMLLSLAHVQVAGAAQPSVVVPSGMVLVPASEVQDVERAAREVSRCASIQTDAERLACYDEVTARRLPSPDHDLPVPRGRVGFSTKGLPRGQEGMGASTGAPVAAGQDPSASGHSVSASGLVPGRPGAPMGAGIRTMPALPSLGADVDAQDDGDSARGRVLLDGSRVSQAVQDVRRSLGSDLTDRWELDDDVNRGRFLLRPYKPMYALVMDWTSSLNQVPSTPNPANQISRLGGDPAVNANQGRRVEAKFQISFKTKVAENLFGNNGDLWVGYTQMSLWQIYSQHLSRPFRETNYEPELMAVFRTNYRIGGWNARLASVSLNHQSNGRSLPLSRSWNRVIFQVGLERDRWTLMLRPWWRIPEDPADDDNPDINDYYGRAEAIAVYRRGGHEWALTLRNSMRIGHGHGAVGLDYAFPISSYLKAHLQVFHGYGASLIDYNRHQTRVGLGVSLVQWL